MKYLDFQEHRQQGTEDFPLAYYYVDASMPHYNMTYHWHPEYEIIRILAGFFQITVNEINYTLKKGDVLVIQDGMLHGGNPMDCKYECLVFDLSAFLRNNHIGQRQLAELLDHRLQILPLCSSNDSEIADVVTTLFEAMHTPTLGTELIVHGALFQLFGLLLQKELFSPARNEHHSMHRLKRLKHVLRYMEANYTEDIALDDLANIAGMNPKYFCRFFKQITHKTPISYLNYYRIERAREQLETTDASITEVAFSCGFNDISYFIKTFKKQKGITPKQYIKQKHETYP